MAMMYTYVVLLLIHCIKYASFLVKLFDSITGYVIGDAGSSWKKDSKGNPVVVAPYSSMPSGYEKGCKYWSKLAKKNSVRFIPPLCPGFSNRTFYDAGIDDWLAC